MYLRHERDGDVRTLAGTVDTADSTLAQARGLMFRRSIPDDYALVFPFGDAGVRDAHMVFVPFDIDAIWIADDVVQGVERLSAWIGHGGHVADTVVELPAGAADGVTPGDRVVVEDDI